MSGTAGKTTLVARLKGKTYLKETVSTDGVLISKVVLDDVTFNVHDFAGQKVYQHTHSLFFDNRAIILAVVSGRQPSLPALEEFFQMLSNCCPQAPIILVSTYADTNLFSDFEADNLKDRYKMIHRHIAVDSSSGTGIAELEQALVKIALTDLKEYTVTKDLPSTFVDLQTKLDAYAELEFFSLSQEEVYRLAADYCKLKDESTKLALNLFKSWGQIHILSNGDIVVKPQQLAEVMACLFTPKPATLARIGDCKQGLVRHSDDIMEAVWGDFKPIHWQLIPLNSSATSELSSPFLDLLHESKLAYRLFDPSGTPLNASLVPALLPEMPAGEQFQHASDVNDSQLCSALLGQSIDSASVFTMSFASSLPISFMSRLQVKLWPFVELGSSWKKGFVITVVLRENKQSKAVVFERESDKNLVIICRDADVSARLLTLRRFLELQKSDFPTLIPKKDSTFLLKAFGNTWSYEELEDNYNDPGYFDKSKGRKSAKPVDLPKLVDIRDLSCLFDNDAPATTRSQSSELSTSDANATAKTTSSFMLPPKAPSMMKNVDILLDIPEAVKKLKAITEKMAVQGITNFLSSIHFELGLALEDALQVLITDKRYFNLPFKPARNSLNTIWPVLEKKEGSQIIRSAVPMTPGLKIDDAWLFLNKHAVELGKSADHRNNHNENTTADPVTLATVEIFINAIYAMGTYIPTVEDGWTVNRNCFFSDLNSEQRKLHNRQSEEFCDVGGRVLWVKFANEAHRTYVRKDLDNILDNQTKQNDVHTKFYKENQVALTKIDQKLDKVVAVAEKILSSFTDFAQKIRSDLQGNTESINELRTIWRDGIDSIENKIEKGGKDMNALVKKELKTFELLNKNFLEENQLDRGSMNAQFNEIKDKLNEALAKENGGSGGNDVKLILTELRTLQAQMAQVIQITTYTQKQLKKGFEVIKKTIVNVNQRTFPTVFIIIDTNVEEFGDSNSKVTSTDAAGSRFAKSFITNMKSLYSVVNDPKAALLQALRDENQAIALICEVCRKPQPNPYAISKPKEVVGSLLPLAAVGMQLVRATNFVGGIGQIFGFPTPHVDKQSLDDFEQFIDGVGEHSLKDYEELQRRAEANYTSNNDKVNNTGSNSSSGNDRDNTNSNGKVTTMSDLGYCAREFHRFLRQVDETDGWCELSPYLTEAGEVFFACKQCASAGKN